MGLIVFLTNPLGLGGNSAFLFASLVMTIVLWATEAVHKSFASLYLLLVFIVFGQTPALEVVSFSWSNTMLLIITTQLLSMGMMKSGIIDGPVEKLMRRTASNLLVTLLLPYLLGVVLIFVIPQAFARVLILGSVYDTLLKAGNVQQSRAKQALMFNAFLAVAVTSMAFLSGDIVLNHSAVSFSGAEAQAALTFGNWARWMTVPTIVTSIVILVLLRLLFAKEFSGYHVSMLAGSTEKSRALPRAKRVATIATMVVIITAWMTEGLHGVAAWMPALGGVIVMAFLGPIARRDLRSINPHFLLFITAAFSIGKVLGQAGITDVIFHQLERIAPAGDSFWYLPAIAVITMLLHMSIGSAVATMSVVLPIMIPMAVAAGFPPHMITLIVYILVDIHFLFPFHHATLLIGSGKKYYEDTFILKTGIVMTVVSLLLVFFVFIPWWNVTGLSGV